MELNEESIKFAYEMLLNRTPSADEVSSVSGSMSDLDTLRRVILNSEEFRVLAQGVHKRIDNSQPPVLIHLRAPKTAGTTLTAAFGAEPKLAPGLALDDNTLNKIINLPRTERMKFRYIFGHISMGLGEAIDLPHKYLFVLRRPKTRIFSLYQYTKRIENHVLHDEVTQGNLSFGEYLELVLNHEGPRFEVDNGQTRRLAGPWLRDTLGQERQLMKDALSNALSPNMILGFVECLPMLEARLEEEGYLTRPIGEALNVSPNPKEYDAAVAALTPEQQELFEAYTAWDEYLYDVCYALLGPQN